MILALSQPQLQDTARGLFEDKGLEIVLENLTKKKIVERGKHLCSKFTQTNEHCHPESISQSVLLIYLGFFSIEDHQESSNKAHAK